MDTSWKLATKEPILRAVEIFERTFRFGQKALIVLDRTSVERDQYVLLSMFDSGFFSALASSAAFLLPFVTSVVLVD
jgi:hypothetical protein